MPTAAHVVTFTCHGIRKIGDQHAAAQSALGFGIMHCSLSLQVGYNLGPGSIQETPETRLTFCTPFTLMELLSPDQQALDAGAGQGTSNLLPGVTHIVVDEAHLRTQDSDLLLLALKLRMAAGMQARLVFMSEALQPRLISRYFADLCHVPKPLVVGTQPSPVQTLFLEQLSELKGVQLGQLASYQALMTSETVQWTEHPPFSRY